jgi:hypothetical protein
MSAFCSGVERKKKSNILSHQESPFAYPINRKSTFSLFVIIPSSPLQSTRNTHTPAASLASLKLHETSTDAASTFTLRRGSTSSTSCAAAAAANVLPAATTTAAG